MYSSPYFIISAAFSWLKYCRYGIKQKSINVLFLEMFLERVLLCSVFFLAPMALAPMTLAPKALTPMVLAPRVFCILLTK